MSDQAYPLSWPQGWPRTQYPGPSKFGAHTVHEAVTELNRQLGLLKAAGIVISSNVTLGNQNPKDRGVCVYFQLKQRPYAMPCDKWSTVADNLWALGKHIESMRGQERWGVGSLERAFAGFAALPAPSSPARSWLEVLALPSDRRTYEAAADAYRMLSKIRHPDLGGSHEAMTELNNAWAEARKHFGR